MNAPTTPESNQNQPAPDSQQAPLPTLMATLMPNSQTTVSGLAGAVTYLFIVTQHARGIDYPAGAEVSIGIVVMAVVSYAHDFFYVLLNKWRK